MDTDKQQWITWLASVPEEKRASLREAILNGHSNGHSTSTGERPRIKVTRTPTADLLIGKQPVFEDVNGLVPIFEKLAGRHHLILKGPKGVGKSLAIYAWLAQRKLPVVVEHCTEETKSINFRGSAAIVGSEVIFTLGSIPTAIEAANDTGFSCLLLEEMSALTPSAQKQINSLTDFQASLSMPNIERIFRLRDGAKVWVVGTMNPSVYGGTYDINEDLKSRFQEIEVGYPAPGQEVKIVKANCGQIIPDQTLDLLIRFAKETRSQATGYALSTRDIVRLAETVALVGLTPALQMVLCKFEGEDRKVMLTRITSIFGGQNILKTHWGAVS